MANNESSKEKLKSEEPSFGILLKKYREEAGITQKELRRRLEDRGYPVSSGCLSNYENNRRRPEDATLIVKIAECLGFEGQLKVERMRAMLMALYFDGMKELASLYLIPSLFEEEVPQ